VSGTKYFFLLTSGQMLPAVIKLASHHGRKAIVFPECAHSSSSQPHQRQISPTPTEGTQTPPQLSPSCIAQSVVVQSEATEGQPPQKAEHQGGCQGPGNLRWQIREAAKMFRVLVEKQIGIHSIHLQRGSHQSVCEKAQTSIWSVTRIITAIFIDSLPPQLLLLSDLSGTHFR